MPKREGEPLSKFIGRFVGDKAEEKKFPDRKQRLAVCYAEARESSKKVRLHGKS